jgi:hypothetical protein
MYLKIHHATEFDQYQRPCTKLGWFDRLAGSHGDGFREFEAGDLVLLGSNLPHVLKENPQFKEAYPALLPCGLII